MATLLHVQASPRKERGKSIKIAHTFLETYASINPADDIVTLDLWSARLPEINGDTLNAKYRLLHGEVMTASEVKAWAEVEQTIRQFTGADKFLFSVPMWNFGVPYRLKHYIDVLTQPGYTFSFNPETGGYTGLVTFRPATVIYARGGAYPENLSFLDLQSVYMKLWLGFIGIADVNSIVVEPTLSAPEQVQSAHDNAVKQATELARRF